MLWYEGSIAEAIQKSRQEGAVFGVAIFGDDDISRQLETSLADGMSQEAINAGRFVFIRISANSEEHRQFSQIFSNALAGSIYLIGNAGAVLDLTNSSKTPAELKLSLNSAWTKHSSPGVAQQPQQPPVGTAQAVSRPPVSTPQEGAAPRLDSSNTAQALANANEAVRVAEEAAGQADLTLEQKIERAQQLAAAKRQQKLAQEAEEERQREKERREMGKGMAELKRWQEEEEAKRHIEQRKKEKIEEQELRKRVKEQIAQDRAARNARSNVSFLNEGPVNPDQTSGPRPAGVGITASAARDYSGQARLQFRIPTGSSISHGFDPDETTLANVRDFLITNNHVPYRQFNLSLAYPRREFTASEYSSSLRDLGLVPSAALLVLPINSSTSIPGLGSGSSVGNWLSILFSYLFIPFTFIYSLFQRALPASSSTTQSSAENTSRSPAAVAAARARMAGQPGQTTSTSGVSNSSSSSSTSSSAAHPRGDSSSNSDVRNRQGNKREKKPEGNIHRLRTNEEDSDDDQGTWNGNSTQQM